ncbi:uncharacterized protein C8Q71DRAFT_253137 [Rhodofomes roseus]|uniref:Uncharacterized protein n=1 Tax=Rhodofomes roseus TaxID=34475 RepID=A0ABQ8K5V8_9APHY|nr:uncharacterized protein C8Q71DRAFT_253137 [Rhodofomes roseus]KAH9832463.1 hypothetical protein C8Q71DRAFT_253137 [Rhodofomes roseus]
MSDREWSLHRLVRVSVFLFLFKPQFVAARIRGLFYSHPPLSRQFTTHHCLGRRAMRLRCSLTNILVMLLISVTLTAPVDWRASSSLSGALHDQEQGAHLNVDTAGSDSGGQAKPGTARIGDLELTEPQNGFILSFSQHSTEGITTSFLSMQLLAPYSRIEPESNRIYQFDVRGPKKSPILGQRGYAVKVTQDTGLTQEQLLTAMVSKMHMLLERAVRMHIVHCPGGRWTSGP